MTVRRPLVLVSGAIEELPSGDTLPGGGGGATDINDLGDATGSDTVALGANSFSITVGAATGIVLDGSGLDPFIGLTAYQIQIGDYGSGNTQLLSPSVSIGQPGGFVGFFGLTTQTQIVPPDLMDGEIASISFSNPPTQAECETLRNASERLADEVAAIRQALYNFGLLSPI